jgi:hypothetical protein
MKTILMNLLLISLVLPACGKAKKPKLYPAGSSSTASGIDGSKTTDGGMNSKGGMLTCSATDGKTYMGFGNVSLVAGRKTEVPKEGDRFRVKPYSVLAGEFTRVLGSEPASLAANATSFVSAPDRWYVDTQASAITLFTSFRVAYEGALKLASSDAKFAAAPTEESASANCNSFARQAWNRLPTVEEVAACKKVALIETVGETDVKARWAYTLASVLAAANFLSY